MESGLKRRLKKEMVAREGRRGVVVRKIQESLSRLQKGGALPKDVHWLMEFNGRARELEGKRFKYLCRLPIIGRICYTKDIGLITCAACLEAREERLEEPRYWVREVMQMGWDDVKQGSGGDFIKIESGAKARLHVLSEEPHSYKQYYNDTVNRGVVVPDDFDGGGKQLRAQHALVVFNMDTKEAKVWLMGNRVAGEVKNIYDNYQGLASVDLVVSRQGTGKSTKYGIVPVPTKFSDELIEGLTIPEPSEISALQPADAETIEKLMAGEDPATEFGAPEEEKVEEEAAEAIAEEPVEEELAKPAPKAAVKPIAAKSTGTPGDPRSPLIRFVMHAFATKPKFKDPKVRLATIKKVSKKTIVSQLSADELKKLQVLVK